MNRRRLGIFLMGGGILLAVAVAAVVLAVVNDADRLRAEQPKRIVAIAKEDVPERTTITVDQIDVVKLPDRAIPPGSVSATLDGGVSEDTVTQQLRDQIKDQFTPQRVYRGEVFNRDRLGRDALKNTPSFDLPQGRVAYPFPVRVNGGSPQNERLLVGFLNAVRPGDFVDVYYSSLEFPPGLPPDVEQREREAHSANYLFTRRLMQNIKAMNIGFFPDAAGKAAETPRDDRYLTLEVTPDQALQLKWIKDVSTFAGNVEFVLRSPLDTQPFPAQTITFDSMSQNYQIGTGR